MTDDHDLKHLLRQWDVSPPDAATQTRLINTALTTPQIVPWFRRSWFRRSWLRRLARECELAFTHWTYALPYKVGAAAACLMLGAGLGGNLAEEPLSVANLALMALTGGAG